MTAEEQALVLRTLRDLGLRIVESRSLADGSMTVRVARPAFKE